MSVLSETRTRRNPYVGPRPFETGEQLYGRDDELYRLVNLLVAKRIVLLYSPSGAGKTSLIQAGLIPRLASEGFNILPVIRVNLDLPAAELPPTANRYVVSTVSSLDRPLPLSEQVNLAALAGTDLATYLNRRPRTGEGRRYDVLIFDQFEELLTLDPTDQHAKQAFMDQVGEVLRDRHRWALFSMREEFIAGLEPYLRSIPTRLATTFRLDLLTETAARAAMQSQASGSGVNFSDAAARLLVDELRRTRVQRSDGAHEELGPYVEPVHLQVVCRQLWERLPPDVTAITGSHVVDLGDVDTALAGYYDERIRTVADSTGVSERSIRDWFDHITEQGFRTQVLSGPDGEGDRDQEVLDALQSTYLIRAEQRRGATWYELAHDRLIAPVRESNAEWREATLTPFQRAAVLWNQYDRSDAFLLTDEALAEAAPSVSGDTDLLTQVERDFLGASQRARDERARVRRQERRIRRLAVTASLVSVIALIAFGLALVSSHDARHQTRLAKARELVTVAGSVASADPSLRTLLYLEAVNRAGSGGERIVMDARQSLYEALYHSKPAPLFTLPTTGAILVAATPDGRRIATAGGRGAGQRQVEIWDVEIKNGQWTSSTDPVTIPNTAELISIALSSDGRTVATAGADGKGRLWDAEAPAKQPVELPHAEKSSEYEPLTERLNEQTAKWVRTVALSGDGHRVVTTGEDGFVHIWNAAGEWLETITTSFGTTAAAFNPQDSNEMALATRTGRIVLWDSIEGEDVGDFDQHTGAVLAVAFDSTGTRLASAAENGWLTVHDVESGESLLHLRHPDAVNDVQHQHFVNTVAFSASGNRVATGGGDGRAVVWDLASRQRVAVFAHDERPVWGVAFRGDNELVVASDDAAPGLWEVPAHAPEGHRFGLGAADISSDNSRLVTASADETAKLWDVSTGDQLFALPHTGKVYAAIFNHDGSRVVTASSDTTAKLWDASTGEALFTLRHGDEVTVADFSHDGRRVITAADDRTAKLWDPSTGEELFTLRHGDWVRSASFSPDGRLVVTASRDRTAKLWDPSTGKELFSLGHDSTVLSTAWAPDGKWVATGADDGSVTVWDAASGERLPWREESGHAGRVNAITFSSDGTRLLTGSADHTARVWDAMTGEDMLRLDHDGEVRDVAFGPTGNIVATAGTDWLARVWDVGSRRQTAWLNHAGPVEGVLFNGDGTALFTAGDDGNARAWDIPSGSARTTFGRSPFRHSAEVSDVEFSRDGQILGTASDDGTVKLWTTSGSPDFRHQRDSAEAPGVLWGLAARTDPRTLSGHSGSVFEISFSAERNQLATASEDRTAKIWDIASGTALYTLAHADIVSDVTFSPDGRFVATASHDRTAVIWDREGNKLHELPHDDVIYSVNFTADGRRLATASDDGTVRVWDARNGRQVGESLDHDGPAYEVVFSEDGRLMATASGASVELWNAGDVRRPERTFHTGSDESNGGVDVSNLAFSADGKSLAAGTVDGIVVWDVGNKRSTPFLRVSQGGADAGVWLDVRAVSFSPDGKRLAAAGAGDEFYVYELDPERLRAMARDVAGRSLSAAECKRYISPDGCGVGSARDGAK